MTTSHVKDEHLHFPTPHNSEHLTHPHYRADIDGLRAIAVLSVVVFHAFPDWVKGGFIGVDIFFVISGFLISTIIFGSLERNDFSFVEFYSRRIMRIFPALLLVLIASLAFGWDALLADEYKQLGKHIAGGAGFVSNFLFWNEAGYFDNAAETKPLLHLWSLGVEEQFYIFWPLLLWGVWKKRLNLLIIAIVVGASSFFLNVYTVRSNAAAAFYSPQTRFWELMVGSVLAYMTLHKQSILPAALKLILDKFLCKILMRKNIETNCNTLRNVQSLIGAGLIVIGVLLITKVWLFPGWWAILPTLGAALIISAGAHAWLNHTVLSNRVLVWFGLISFPLYLWHWPLLSFARIANSETPTPELRIALVLISIVLAWLTYRFIEKPIRFGGHKKTKTIILTIFMLIVGYVGSNTYMRDGLNFRLATHPHIKNDGDTGQESYLKYQAEHFFLCTPIDIQKEAPVSFEIVRCSQSKKDEALKIALIGDSHAEHLFIGLAEALPEMNIAFYIKNRIPTINYSDSYVSEYNKIFEFVINDANITTVILSAYWLAHESELPTNGTYKTELLATVDKLTAANKKVYIVGGIPQIPFDPKQCQIARKYSQQSNNCKADKNYFYSRYESYYADIKSLEKDNLNVNVLDVAKYFCDGNFCNAAINGHLLYRDQHHLNINGSQYLGKKIIEDYPQLAN